MESQRFPADGAPPTFPKESPLETAKEPSKEKDKKTRAEMVAHTAIKEIKKPEGLLPALPSEDAKPLSETWLGTKDGSDTTSSKEKSDGNDTIEHAEMPEPSEHITHQEARQLVNEYIDARLPIVEQEQAETDQPAEVAAATANKSFLEQLRDDTHEDAVEEIPAEVLIDQAMTDVLKELGLEDSVAAREAEPEPIESDESGGAKAPDAVPLTPAEPSVLPAIENAMPTPNTEIGNGSGGNQEPPSPPDTGSFEGDNPDDFNSVDTSGPHAFFANSAEGSSETEHSQAVIIPNERAATRAEQQRRDSERRQAMMSGLLVGGVIGYIIGRRRGRITTEKKFKPIQEQLQKEADTLRQTIATREQHIRVLAREKATAEQEARHTAAKRERLLNAPAKLEQSPAEARDTTIATILEVPVATVERAEIDARPPVALNEVQRPLAAVSRTETSVAAAGTASTQTEQLITPKAVEQMPLPAVLKAAETVVVGGKTLKSFYESGRIEEPALRRVLAEHLRSGRTEQALNVALLSHEQRKGVTSFERRDRVSGDKDASAQRQAAIEHHAEQFSKNPGNAAATVMPQKDPIDQYEDSEAALDVRNTQRNISIVAGAAIIVAVVLFIVTR